MLASAKEVGALIAERLPKLAEAFSLHDDAIVAPGAEISRPSSAAEMLEGMPRRSEAGDAASWAYRELKPALLRFDESLEAALPNLVVAKPWLTELIRPLQGSLHAVVTNASSWRESDPDPLKTAERRVVLTTLALARFCLACS